MSMNSPKQKHMRLATYGLLAGACVCATVTFAIGVSIFAGMPSSAEPVTPVQPTTPMQIVPPDLPKVYMPGLGEFMQAIQIHHAKLWLAAKARNWPLAEYQLSEMKEVFSDVEDLVPTYKSVPVGQMIEAITTGAVAELEKAVDEKNLAKFTTAYNKLTAACNDCHKAASRGFIQIRRPTHSTFANENFAPARK